MTRARTDASDEADAPSLTGSRCGMRRGVHRCWLNRRLNKRESHGWFGVPKNPNSRGVSVLWVEQDVESFRPSSFTGRRPTNISLSSQALRHRAQLHVRANSPLQRTPAALPSSPLSRQPLGS
jgi:hypothetical protein